MQESFTNEQAVSIIVERKNNKQERILLKHGESLLNGLLAQKIQMPAVCGGNGRCGSCKVRVLHGEAPISAADKEVLSKEELSEGFRLSCRLKPVEDMVILIAKQEEEFAVVSTYVPAFLSFAATTEKQDGEKKYGIGIDIGTTTLVFQLLASDGTIICTQTAVNGQRRYGADVISRIQIAAAGGAEELRECIKKDLQKGIRTLLEEGNVQAEQIAEIVLSCNTTMGHLLMGYDCTGLGAYPFTTVNIRPVKGTVESVLGLKGNAITVLLPGISAYVGGDIVSGLYACGADDWKEPCLFIDLGTNGEMALGNGEKLLVASAAAGPAFEGGSITWGMGSVEGAICSVSLTGRVPRIRTIGDKPPEGICGTGLVEAAAELLRAGLMDETGLLADEYFETGFLLAVTGEGKKIVITQKDIRELQLAKAAIRAGIETLLFRYGISGERIARVYLAGGFGYKLRAEKAIAVGMLPEELEGKICTVGNTSLAGAAKYLRRENAAAVMDRLIGNASEISLSEDEFFQEKYIAAMQF